MRTIIKNFCKVGLAMLVPYEKRSDNNVYARGVEEMRRLKLPLAAEREGTGLFAYTISPSMVLVDVLEIGGVLCE